LTPGSACNLLPLTQTSALAVLRARRRILRWLAVSPLVLAGCATPWTNLPPLPSVPTGEYLLGPDDRIRIITFGNEQLTGEFRVSASGDVELPLLGTVHAAGLTPRQLGDRVAALLAQSRLFKSPSVSVEVVAYRPIFALGEVNRPGQYPYQPRMTVLTAVSIAGGFTYRAVDDVFSVVRSSGASAVEYRASRQGFLEPGDVLTVYERRF
jgi:polysaccharide biosynthesis/export protein